MTIRMQKLLICLSLVFLVAVEGRWHNLKVLRKHDAKTADNQDLDGLINGSDEYRRHSSDKQFIHHRRYYPKLSAENGDSDEKLTEDEMEDFRESKIPVENARYDDAEGFERIPRRRLVGHRRPRVQTKHLHHRSLKRHHESPDYINADPLDLVREQDQEDLDASRTRGKRHYHRRPWTEKDKKAFNESRLKLVQLENEKTYEVEVKEAQNSSLCNYTVIPIPDPGDRVPSELEHVRCNHVGSRCQDVGTYCCIQTYRNIEVMYESTRTKEVLKVYSGCVCSLQIYGTLEPYIPDLTLDE